MPPCIEIHDIEPTPAPPVCPNVPATNGDYIDDMLELLPLVLSPLPGSDIEEFLDTCSCSHSPSFLCSTINHRGSSSPRDWSCDETLDVDYMLSLEPFIESQKLVWREESMDLQNPALSDAVIIEQGYFSKRVEARSPTPPPGPASSSTLVHSANVSIPATADVPSALTSVPTAHAGSSAMVEPLMSGPQASRLRHALDRDVSRAQVVSEPVAGPSNTRRSEPVLVNSSAKGKARQRYNPYSNRRDLDTLARRNHRELEWLQDLGRHTSYIPRVDFYDPLDTNSMVICPPNLSESRMAVETTVDGTLRSEVIITPTPPHPLDICDDNADNDTVSDGCEEGDKSPGSVSRLSDSPRIVWEADTNLETFFMPVQDGNSESPSDFPKSVSLSSPSGGGDGSDIEDSAVLRKQFFRHLLRNKDGTGIAPPRFSQRGSSASASSTSSTPSGSPSPPFLSPVPRIHTTPRSTCKVCHPSRVPRIHTTPRTTCKLCQRTKGPRRLSLPFKIRFFKAKIFLASYRIKNLKKICSRFQGKLAMLHAKSSASKAGPM
ncbi:hypothetical protein CPC08DRAFT_731510 [Agrocybe pediades]|nr:hypothetical protein CPC08DRAFT_731510 [Agrocybe pediades]